MSNQIIDLHARQILDSRGSPTLEAEVYTPEFIGSAAVPSGASTGVHEAHELRDDTKAYHKKGVGKAVHNVNTEIKQELIGEDIAEQEQIDERLNLLDGTANKKRLGANAILATSLAISRAASASYEMPLYAYIAKLTNQPLDQFTLPMPFANVINGGVHAGNDLMPQEFMIVPIKAKNFGQATQIVAEIYHELKEIIVKKHGKNAANVGDEGGFAPPVQNAREALNLLDKAVQQTGYEGKVAYAMDPAASEFYKNNRYEVEKGTQLSREELANYWLDLLKKYPIISLEDPFAQDDYEGWQLLMKQVSQEKKESFPLKKKPQIVGDDLTVTNPKRIQEAIDNNLCNALLLKVNQVGTLTESLQAAKKAQDAGWTIMVSHRSGETEDPYIADLAVGLSTGQIKLGAPCRSDRTTKYNQLLRIEQELEGSDSKIARY